MSQILHFLNQERDLAVPFVKELIVAQKNKYGHLTPEFAKMLNHLETYLLRGGKWHRPALTCLAYRIASGRLDISVRRGSVALELIHRYLLIHDDIIDRDMVRHGGPTLEEIYRNHFDHNYAGKSDAMYSKGMAIVAGDIVNSMAYETVLQSGVEPWIMTAVCAGLNELIMETGAGWQLQTEQNYKAIEEVTQEAYTKGMELVSAQYSLVWPLRIGQIFAGRLAESEWDQALDDYGLAAGTAFQIMDDVLGMFGQSEKTGKPVGHDYREGKKTLLLLLTYKQANQDDQEFLTTTLGTEINAGQLARVQNIMISTGALEEVQALADQKVKQAISALKRVNTLDDDAMTILAELAEFLSNRDY